MQNEIKIVFVGNSGVGKTCIVTQETTKTFSESTVSTLGASYLSEIKSFNGIDFRLQIWDTAGQERYRGLTPMYYRNAQIAIICYAIDDRSSFEGVDNWIESINNNADDDTILFLVGNKIDLTNREISTDDGKKKAESIKAEFVEVSAKTGQGINELFNLIPRIYIEKSRNKAKPDETIIKINDANNDNQKKCC